MRIIKNIFKNGICTVQFEVDISRWPFTQWPELSLIIGNGVLVVADQRYGRPELGWDFGFSKTVTLQAAQFQARPGEIYTAIVKGGSDKIGEISFLAGDQDTVNDPSETATDLIKYIGTTAVLVIGGILALTYFKGK